MKEATIEASENIRSARRAVARRPEKLPPRGECTDSQFDAWVAAATERLDPFMAWLGVVFALVVGYELAVDLSGTTASVVHAVGWAIWALFAAEFATKLWLAPHRRTFLRRHWWQLLLLTVPFLRVLRFFRLLRLGRAFPASRVISSSYRAAGTARFLLRSRLAYLGGLATVTTIAIAELAYIFERDVDGATLDSFAEALLWSATIVLALQGDPVPESIGAQVVMVLGFVVGLVLIASLAGVVGSFLVEERGERAASAEG